MAPIMNLTEVCHTLPCD